MVREVARLFQRDTTRLIDQRKLLGFFFRVAFQLVLLLGDLELEHLLLGQHGDELASAHRECASKETRHAGQQNDVGTRASTGHAHDKAGVGDETVIDAEHTSAKRAASVGLMAASNVLDGCRPRMALCAVSAFRSFWGGWCHLASIS